MKEEFEEKSEKVRTLISDTSAHGFRNVILKSRNRIARYAWALLVTVMTVSLFFSLYDILLKVRKYPFYTVVKIEEKRELDFPTITLCDLSIIDATKFNDSKTSVFNFFLQYSSRKFQVLSTKNSSDDVGNMTIDDVYAISNVSADELFELCLWENTRVRCGDVWTPVFTDMGRCYMFNRNSTDRYKSRSNGVRGGLRVIASINQRGYILSNTIAAGLKMVLQDPHQYPDVVNNGIAVSPGLATLIGLKQTSFLPEPYKAYGNNSCVSPEDESLILKIRQGSIYDQETCIRRCLGEEAINNCSCKSMVEADENDVPFCTLKQMMECYDPILEKLYRRSKDYCDCPQVCSFNKYKTSVSIAMFPSNPAGEILAEMGLISKIREYKTQSFDISVFFEDLLLEEISHVPEYSFTSLLGTVGGQMGLFLGMSLVTINEIMEIIVWGIWLGLLKIKNYFFETKVQQIPPQSH